MRRVSMLLTALILAALLLAACGGQETSTSVPGTNVPPVTVEATSTSELTVTETTSPDTTTTPEVPVTGENSPSRVTNLIGAPVCGMGGDELATVQDLVMDFDQTMVTYVVVDANGRNVVVPWKSFYMQAAMGAGTSGQQNCLALTVDDDTFNNAPDFDLTTMLPGQGQPAMDWDATIRDYWANPGAGGTGTTTIGTPSAGGTSATAMPNTTMTATASTGGTGAGAGTGTGTGQGQGAQQMQGVMLATDILGATVMVSPQGNDQGAGPGTGNAAGMNTPEAGATSTGSTPQADGTATATSSTGTGSASAGDFSKGTVEDIIIDPASGDLQYLVVSFGGEQRWIPIPIGFLRWDAATSSFVLMINENALQNAPAFSADQFPDTSTPGWDQEFSDFWHNNAGTGGTGTGTGTGSATSTPAP